MSDIKVLSQFSSETEVLELVYNAYRQLSELSGFDTGETVYDSKNGKCISYADVETVIAQMRVADKLESLMN